MRRNAALLVLLTYSLYSDIATGCPGGNDICDWMSWGAWSSCSMTCGGGSRSRTRLMCCDTSDSWEVCMNKCGTSDKDWKQTENCGEVCFNEGVLVSEGNRWCNCTPLFTDTCCDIRTCSWDQHYCWPGRCSGGDFDYNYASTCSCAPGFYKRANASETTCQLRSTTAPTIHTCETKVDGSNGEMKRAKHTRPSNACLDLPDFYGNFQPKHLIYDLLAEFTVNISSYSKPDYINDSSFGVTDVNLEIEVQTMSGAALQIMNHSIFTGKADSYDVKSTVRDQFNITLDPGVSHLSDGQWLCARYEANGGGYLMSVDLSTSNRTTSSPVPYAKTTASRRLCYRYDSSAPRHCKQNSSCTHEPLQISEMITRSPLITASFLGWNDPIPSGGSSKHASGIESYTITVHEVSASNDTLKVDTSVIYEEKVDSSTTSLQLNLTTETPKLYAVYLHVKDVADNVRQARRFVLFDDSSVIETRSEKAFFVQSASKESNFTWQTHHHPICLNWTDYFFNKYYRDYLVLSSIEPDPSRLISGIYDQQLGSLRIGGTPNAFGIVDFRAAWSSNGSNLSSEIQIQNFQNQSFCKNFVLTDGDTYTIKIRAIDIVNNSHAENRTVHIDTSAPLLLNVSLVGNDSQGLLIHVLTDISNTSVNFEALDPHSGLKRIQWSLARNDSESKLLAGGDIQVAITSECNTNSSGNHGCYCPSVGKCEFSHYSIPIGKLLATDHLAVNRNQNYVITVKVTNNALLSSTQQLYFVASVSQKNPGTCSWDQHYCWPGRCSSGDYDYDYDYDYNYASTCSCAPGFYKRANASETTCQLRSTTAPTIHTCETKVDGPNGEMKRAKHTRPLKACLDLADFYGNFQPKHLIYDLLAEFTVNISSYSKPAYINDSSFGVTDVNLEIEVQTMSGATSHVMNHSIFTGKVDSYDVKSTVQDLFNITLDPGASHLSDGQWLCARYEAKGGGYLLSVDLSTSNRTISSPVPYAKTKSSRRLCYRYDSSAPRHCKQNSSCSHEPLQISEMITRSPLITASFLGWNDPIPSGGSSKHASGIEFYRITVHEVSASNDTLKVDTSVIYEEKVDSSTTSLQLNLTTEKHHLYAVYLHVKDVADNVRQARRFVLFDDSSVIETRSEKAFFVQSASKDTNFTWQTHHSPICLNWTDYFFNKYYRDNPLLSSIEPDPSGLISGIYDQQFGPLQIGGTPNAFGIVDFRVAWSFNGSNISSEIQVPNFQNQSFCKNFVLTDGDTYTLKIRAIDKVNNSHAENRTVHIDASAPLLLNVSLVGNDSQGLLMNYLTDISNKSVNFEALDPHSGLNRIQWSLARNDSESELLAGGDIQVAITSECNANSSGNHGCYCPSVGKCEFSHYSIPIDKLLATEHLTGKRNQSYVITVKVTNNALLSSTQQMGFVVSVSENIPEHNETEHNETEHIVLSSGCRSTSEVQHRASEQPLGNCLIIAIASATAAAALTSCIWAAICFRKKKKRANVTHPNKNVAENTSVSEHQGKLNAYEKVGGVLNF